MSVSIDGGEHAEYFLSKRGGDAQIVEVEVPKWFIDFLQENAIPQVNYKTILLNQGEQHLRLQILLHRGIVLNFLRHR